MSLSSLNAYAHSILMLIKDALFLSVGPLYSLLHVISMFLNNQEMPDVDNAMCSPSMGSERISLNEYCGFLETVSERVCAIFGATFTLNSLFPPDCVQELCSLRDFLMGEDITPGDTPNTFSVVR